MNTVTSSSVAPIATRGSSRGRRTGSAGNRTVIQDRIQHARNLDFFKQFFVTSHDVFGTGMFLVAVGVVLGVAGSAVAVSRFLDV